MYLVLFFLSTLIFNNFLILLQKFIKNKILVVASIFHFAHVKNGLFSVQKKILITLKIK